MMQMESTIGDTPSQQSLGSGDLNVDLDNEYAPKAMLSGNGLHNQQLAPGSPLMATGDLNRLVF